MTLPSEIKGKGALSAFAALIDPLCNLVEDEDTREMYRQEKKPDERSSRSYIVSLVYKILSRHEDDFCRIMAVCYGTTPGEYAGDQRVSSIVQYVAVREHRRAEEEAYRIYVTDALYALVRRDQMLNRRFIDVLRPRKIEEPEEIIARFRAAFGGDEE